MDDINNWSKNLKYLEQQANLLEHFIALQFKRSTIIPELEELNDYSEETTTNIERFQQIINNELDPLMEQYNKLKTRIHQQQVRMLTIMENNKQRESNILLEFAPHQSVKKINCISSVKSPLMPIDNSNFKAAITPQLFLSDYYDGVTPSKLNNPCRSLNYFDVDLPNITQEMFDQVPKYMKGRITLEELINFLDSIIVSCFNEKYLLLQKKRELVKNKELVIWNAFKAQTFLFPNQKFITQGDISRKCNKLIDRKISDKLTILRHLKILQEKRKESTICYIWIR